MPSKRNPNKELVGGFYSRSFRDLLNNEAIKARKSRTQLMSDLVIQALLENEVVVPQDILETYKGPIPEHMRAKLGLPPSMESSKSSKSPKHTKSNSK